MVLTIVGKGDLLLLPHFNEGDFASYELYLSTFNDKAIQEGVAQLPSHIKISSIHNPTWVDLGERIHPFDLAESGKIGQASLSALIKTICLAKQLEAKIVVIHGATYNIFTESKEEALSRVAERVKPLFKEGINLCFETDVLWHNTYYSRRALLAEEENFCRLNNLLGGRIKITADIEHLNLSSYFLGFVNMSGGEQNFMKKYSAEAQKRFEKDYLAFVHSDFHNLQEKAQQHIASFFSSFRESIEHIHINGSDPKNYFFNPETTLPLVGEHLPLGLQEESVSDRLNYPFLLKLFYQLPSQKEIHLVLELWRTNPKEFIPASLQSKKFLEKYLERYEYEK